MAVNLLVLITLLYGLTWRYRRSLPTTTVRLDEWSRDSGIPERVLHGLSWFGPDRKRRDFRQLPSRSPGMVRIGAFGDSFTYGDEVDAELSYPAQLQALLRAEGFDNVEVLNFGGSGYGLGESTHLWETFGRNFDLAFVVHGPLSLIPDRDLSFNSFFVFAPYSVHGRYLLDGGGLRWLQPLGELSIAGRTDAYTRFIPHWQYLRYDRNPPVLLRALLARDRVVSNPFYYSSLSDEEEVAALYPALLRRWAAGSSQVVFTHLDAQRVRHADGLKDRLVALDAGAVVKSFSDRCNKSHLSGAANHRFARIIRDVLMARHPARVEVVETCPTRAAASPGPALDQFSGAEVLFGSTLVAKMVYCETIPFTDVQSVDFKRDQVRSLLFLRRKTSLADGIAVTGNATLRAGDTLEADLDCGGERQRFVVGKVSLVDGSGAIAELESDELDPVIDIPVQLRLQHPDLPGSCRGTLSLQGRALLNFDDGRLRPIQAKLVAAKPQQDTFFDARKLPSTGPIQLRFTGEAPRELEIGQYSIRPAEVNWNREGLATFIRASSTPGKAELAHR
jgi:hypothetical protein